MKPTQHTKYLLVTCCLEETRSDVLKQVVDNLATYREVYAGSLTVFDNASTVDWVVPYMQEVLKTDVCVADKNVGYWSAIHWWLSNIEQSRYTYIIESDMVHYAMERLVDAEGVLNQNDKIGSVRCHKYSVQDMHLYNKDRPRAHSIRSAWQSHTNKVTNKQVNHSALPNTGKPQIYVNNFLTQLPALNRTHVMKECFAELATRKQFSELDFQRLYHERYDRSSIIDGGIFQHDLGGPTADVITGSWTSAKRLQRFGYMNTRFSTIMDPNSYTVSCTKC